MTEYKRDSISSILEILEDIEIAECKKDEATKLSIKVKTVISTVQYFIGFSVAVNLAAQEEVNHVLCYTLGVIFLLSFIFKNRILRKRESEIKQQTMTVNNLKKLSVDLAESIESDTMQSYMETQFDRRNNIHLSAVKLIQNHSKNVLTYR